MKLAPPSPSTNVIVVKRPVVTAGKTIGGFTVDDIIKPTPEPLPVAQPLQSVI
jgi:hypothetical protein